MMKRVKENLPVVVAGALVGTAVLVSLFGEVGILSTWRMDRSRDRIMEENAELRTDIARLRAEVDRLRTSPAHIEEIARKELGLIGKRENVIVLERDQDAPTRDPGPGGPKRR
ncbi:MAG: FtsB family cell division protein [Gemmatimonadota bacterium]